MTPDTLNRLATTRTIDLTTVGRRSGKPSTVEIWWFVVDGRFTITGTPGPRDWLANIRANPRVSIATAGESYEATAKEITDEEFRRHVFTHTDTGWYKSQTDLDRLVNDAPMIEIHFPTP